MRGFNDSGIMLIVIAVGVQEKSMEDERIAGFGHDCLKNMAVLGMLAQHRRIDDRIDTVRTGIQLFAHP